MIDTFYLLQLDITEMTRANLLTSREGDGGNQKTCWNCEADFRIQRWPPYQGNVDKSSANNVFIIFAVDQQKDGQRENQIVTDHRVIKIGIAMAEGHEQKRTGHTHFHGSTAFNKIVKDEIF